MNIKSYINKQQNELQSAEYRTAQREVILEAIVKGHTIELSINDCDGVFSHRRVTPSCIERCSNGATIIRAYCEHRQGFRSFRLDRVVHVEKA